jgi:hypothetical protein
MQNCVRNLCIETFFETVAKMPYMLCTSDAHFKGKISSNVLWVQNEMYLLADLAARLFIGQAFDSLKNCIK